MLTGESIRLFIVDVFELRYVDSFSAESPLYPQPRICETKTKLEFEVLLAHFDIFVYLYLMRGDWDWGIFLETRKGRSMSGLIPYRKKLREGEKIIGILLKNFSFFL